LNGSSTDRRRRSFFWGVGQADDSASRMRILTAGISEQDAEADVT
jgi:hypothetical protein